MNTPKNNKSNKFLLIFVCIFMSLILLVGATFGVVTAVMNANSVARYDNVRISEGTANYLASYYKQLYMKTLSANGINAYDSEYFWSREAEDGKTYGQLLQESFKEYLASILVANDLYSTYSSYTSENKKSVKNAVSEVVLYSDAGGSKDKFNELAEKYGFDYENFLDASELLYKSKGARSAIYGADGSNLANFPDQCAEYLQTYSHVHLLFVRTKDTFALDSEGNRTYDSDGNVIMRPLTDEELNSTEVGNEGKLTIISNLRNYIADGTISTQTFEYYLAKSDGDPDMYATGYYFHPSAESTAEFSEAFSEVVEKSYEMTVGEYAEVECPAVDGVCFIYKEAVAEGAYANSDNVFFSDFYSDAVNYLFPKIFSELIVDVKFNDSFDEIDIVRIPKNSEFTIREWN